MTPEAFRINEYISNRLDEIEDMVGFAPSLVNVDENNVSLRAEDEPDHGNMLYYLGGEYDSLQVMRDFLK